MIRPPAIKNFTPEEIEAFHAEYPGSVVFEVITGPLSARIPKLFAIALTAENIKKRLPDFVPPGIRVDEIDGWSFSLPPLPEEHSTSIPTGGTHDLREPARPDLGA